MSFLSVSGKNWILNFVLKDQSKIELNYVGDEFEFNDIQLNPTLLKCWYSRGPLRMPRP